MTPRRLAFSSLIVLLVVYNVWGQAQQPEVRTGIFRGRKVTYTWIPGKENNGAGKAIFQGDIILDHLQQLPDSGPVPDSLGVAYTQNLWPKVGSVYEVPYTVDPASGDQSNIQTAVSQFNSNFAEVIQFVPYTNQADYVNFDFDPNNFSGSCEA